MDSAKYSVIATSIQKTLDSKSSENHSQLLNLLSLALSLDSITAFSFYYSYKNSEDHSSESDKTFERMSELLKLKESPGIVSTFMELDSKEKGEKRKREESDDEEIEYAEFTYKGTTYHTSNKHMNGIVVGKALGKGIFGEVHEVTVQGGDPLEYVVKIILIEIPPKETGNEDSDEEQFHEKHTSEDMFKREVSIQQKAADVKVAPEILQTFTCLADGEDFGFIIMKRYPISLLSYIRENHPDQPFLDSVRKLVIEKMEKLLSVSIIHGDINAGNIMLVFATDGELSDVKIIDYGKANSPNKTYASDVEWITNDDLWKVVTNGAESEPEDEESKPEEKHLSPADPIPGLIKKSLEDETGVDQFDEIYDPPEFVDYVEEDVEMPLLNHIKFGDFGFFVVTRREYDPDTVQLLIHWKLHIFKDTITKGPRNILFWECQDSKGDTKFRSTPHGEEPMERLRIKNVDWAYTIYPREKVNFKDHRSARVYVFNEWVTQYKRYGTTPFDSPKYKDLIRQKEILAHELEKERSKKEEKEKTESEQNEEPKKKPEKKSFTKEEIIQSYEDEKGLDSLDPSGSDTDPSIPEKIDIDGVATFIQSEVAQGHGTRNNAKPQLLIKWVIRYTKGKKKDDSFWEHQNESGTTYFSKSKTGAYDPYKEAIYLTGTSYKAIIDKQEFDCKTHKIAREVVFRQFMFEYKELGTTPYSLTNKPKK